MVCPFFSTIGGMRKWIFLAQNVFAVIGLALLFSKLISRLFGLRAHPDWLVAHPVWIAVYLAAMLTLAGGCVYGYHRLFGEKDESCREEYQEKVYPAPSEEDIAAARRLCSKPAVVLRSTSVNELPAGYVSCLGRVAWQLPGEEWPTDAEGKRLEPLATLFVPDLPAVPDALKKVALITIYAPFAEYIDPDEDPRMGCVIRTYASLEGLRPCNAVSTHWKTCLLTPVSVVHDMPDFIIDSDEKGEAQEAYAAFFKKFGYDNYAAQVCNAHYETCATPDVAAADIANSDLYAVFETHKFGGYPTYRQDTVERPDGYPYVMQIHSDVAAELNIGDVGSYYFYYNAEKNDWRVEMDCY